MDLSHFKHKYSLVSAYDGEAFLQAGRDRHADFGVVIHGDLGAVAARTLFGDVLTRAATIGALLAHDLLHAGHELNATLHEPLTLFAESTT